MSIIDLKIKTYDELTFEITRLNTDKYLLEQKLQQKENIIKEVREYIEENTQWYDKELGLVEMEGYETDRIPVIYKYGLLEILEKGE